MCMQVSFVLDETDSCHMLTVESATAISAVAVQSDVPLELQQCQEAILSCSPPDPANNNQTLATYR